MIEPILLGLSQVADLDEGDVVEVALVVDVLQLLEDVLVLLVGLVVCSDATKVNLSPSNEHNASNFQLPTYRRGRPDWASWSPACRASRQ